MKGKIMVAMVIVAITLLIGCKKESPTDSTDETGALQLKYTTWNSYSSKAPKATLSDTHTCNLIDGRHVLYSIAFATGDIVDGEPDTLDWITTYESSEEMLDSEREFSPVTMPIGNYKNIRIVQSNRVYFVGTLGSDTLELPNLNNSELEPADSLLNICGENGMYVHDENNNFKLEAPDEKLGGFEMKSGKTTKLTIRVNIKTFDWIDNDGNGEWSEGDELDNWTLPEGIETMTDFIVEYE